MKTITIYSFFRSLFIDVIYKDTSPEDLNTGNIIIYKLLEGPQEAGKIIRVYNKKLSFKPASPSSLGSAEKNNEEKPEKSIRETAEGFKLIRKANKKDLQFLSKQKEKAKKAYKIIIQKISELNLDMHPLNANYSFDDSQIYFNFVAPSRIDFRQLVKIISKDLQKKIHLQQIGPRDRAIMVGGYGKCGKKVCCLSFLESLSSVSMDTVRIQNLAHKGTEKLSGICGKLLCCLNYESSQYRELRKKFPDYNSSVTIDGKEGKVIGLDILNNKIKIRFDENEANIYDINDIKLKKTKKK